MSLRSPSSAALWAIAMALALPCWAARPTSAYAHEFEPPVLSLTERAGFEYEVAWRVPLRVRAGELQPVFPAGSLRVGDSRRRREGGAIVERFRIRVAGGLAGKSIQVERAPGAAEEVLVRVASAEQTATGRLSQQRRAFVVPRVPSALETVRSYLWLGAEHIAIGFDHLLFVLGLVVLAPSIGALVATITAFTVAHSLTLGLSALGFLAVPAPPLEASIALSILFLARELWHRPDAGRTRRRLRLWPMAFVFGLLHGLGFAGALAQIGLPARDVPLALLSFNLGVEFGQLAFVALVYAVALVLPLELRSRLHAKRVPAYAIGAVAGYFFLQRLLALWA